MSSLKEIKERIGTVTSTMKITGAMKMIASVKLHQAQAAIGRIRPYEQQLDSMLSRLLASGAEVRSPFAGANQEGKTAIVVCSSNSGLCGAFNVNVQKELAGYLKGFPKEDVMLFPVGRKIREFLQKNGFPVEDNFDSLSEKPTYEAAASLASTLMDLYAAGKVKRVDVLYHHYRNQIVQVLTTATYLPVEPQAGNGEQPAGNIDYILEPSPEELVVLLLPQVLRVKLFALLLDNAASEHGARTMAMQQATDNATDLLQGLTVQYNKSRQQAITNELLDIAGGSAR